MIGFARGKHLATVVLSLAVLGTVFGCRGYQGPPPIRFWTDDLAFQVSTTPIQPPAREDIVFKVVVRDKNSGQAIEGGEGRVFATSPDGINAWDGLTPGQQPGTYTAKLHFLTAGDWALGMQFRRAQSQPVERLDWKQTIWPGNDEGGTK